MATSHEALKETFINEGKMAIDNDDSGGLTYLGIAYNHWPRWSEWPTIMELCVDEFEKHNIRISVEELKRLGTPKGKQPASRSIRKKVEKGINNILKNGKSDRQAIKFYKKLFWDTIGGDKQISQTFAESMFDFGVNTGTPYTIRLVQRMIRVRADGAFGPTSLQNLNVNLIENHNKLHTHFATLKILKYVKIVKNPKNAKKKKYMYGWLRRTLNTYLKTYDIQQLKNCIESRRAPKYNRNSDMVGEQHQKNLAIIIGCYEAVAKYKKHQTAANRERLIKEVDNLFK